MCGKQCENKSKFDKKGFFENWNSVINFSFLTMTKVFSQTCYNFPSGRKQLHPTSAIEQPFSMLYYVGEGRAKWDT